MDIYESLISISKKDIKRPIRNQIDFLDKSFQYISLIYLRDNLICKICNTQCRRKKIFSDIEKDLPIAHVDHIKPMKTLIKELNITQAIQALVCPEFWDMSNGRTLCINCHQKTSTYGRRC